MKSRVSFPFFLLALLLAGTTLLPAAEGEEDVANKLREALRNTMLQLRDSQNQVATLQATDVANSQKLKDLEGKIDTLTKQAIADRNTSANMVAELNAKLEEQRGVLISFQSAIEKWKKSYSQVTALAQKKEAERAKLEAKSIRLERQVEDQRLRNIKMYDVGLEIIDRYEKFGLGDAILAREPFVGSTRVKFQNLIQNDQDKLADQKIKQP
jgi:chromosome segregation ATPase